MLFVRGCGDGLVDEGEECDDGNTDDGDGCSAACILERCLGTPGPPCVPAGEAVLDVFEKRAGREKLVVALRRLGARTSPADFGDPVGGRTRVDACVYDAGGRLVAQLTVDRPGGGCGSKGRPCWRTLGRRGYRYRDRDAAADGVTALLLRGDRPGKGSVRVRAANDARRNRTALPTGAAAALAGETSAKVRMVTSDAACFEAVLGTVRRADERRFRATGR
jgi:cysteine-rich repeat protein